MYRAIDDYLIQPYAVTLYKNFGIAFLDPLQLKKQPIHLAFRALKRIAMVSYITFKATCLIPSMTSSLTLFISVWMAPQFCQDEKWWRMPTSTYWVPNPLSPSRQPVSYGITQCTPLTSTEWNDWSPCMSSWGRTTTKLHMFPYRTTRGCGGMEGSTSRLPKLEEGISPICMWECLLRKNSPSRGKTVLPWEGCYMMHQSSWHYHYWRACQHCSSRKPRNHQMINTRGSLTIWLVFHNWTTSPSRTSAAQWSIHLGILCCPSYVLFHWKSWLRKEGVGLQKKLKRESFGMQSIKHMVTGRHIKETDQICGNNSSDIVLLRIDSYCGVGCCED